MSICAVILAGLQGKYAFYAAMPVALTFGKYHDYSSNSTGHPNTISAVNLLTPVLLCLFESFLNQSVK